MRGNGGDHRAGGRVTDVRVDQPTTQTAAYSKHKDEGKHHRKSCGWTPIVRGDTRE